MDWIKALPWWVRWTMPGGVGLVSACVGVVSESLQWAGLAVGAALIAVSALGFLWHAVTWFRRRRRIAQPARPDTATAAASPQADTPLEEALAYARFREWGRSATDAWASGEADLAARVHEFEQAAVDGRLSVWARNNWQWHAPLLPVPTEHWETHQVFWNGLIRGEGGRTTRRPDHGEGHGGGLNDVTVSKMEIERIWSPQPRSA